jgi:hypothetical protein
MHLEYPTSGRGRNEQMFSEDFESLFLDIFLGFPTEQNIRPVNTQLDALLPAPTPALQARMDQLVSQLAIYRPHPDVDDSPAYRSEMASAQTVFTAENLHSYVAAYFDYAHPHFPFVHRASFDVLSVSLPLLLAVFMTGSVHCVPQDGALSARSFFDLAEEYVFDMLQRLLIDDDSTDGDWIQTVQAALLMHALRINSNDVHIRRRLRIRRHPMLVASARNLDLLVTKRSAYLAARDWDRFVAEETRIRYVLSGSWKIAHKLINADWGLGFSFRIA